MASKALDFVARLELRAEQFSSEGGKAFAELKTRARSAASEVKASFNEAFASVQSSARTALTLPRTSSGSLNLTAEISQLKAHADQVENDALALRELSIAKSAAAERGGALAGTLRLEADAAAVAALAAEKDAAALREQARATELVQEELNRTISVTRVHTEASGKNASSMGAQRAAMQSLSFQAQDTFTQLAGGANAFQVLAIQGGQAAGSFANLEGKAGSVARFLIGPWGLAITGALLVFGPMVSKLFETGVALDNEVEKLKESAKQTDLNAQAKKAFIRTEEGVAQAIRDSIKANEEWIESQRSAARQAADTARAQELAAKQDLADTRRRLSDARERQKTFAGPLADPRLAPAKQSVDEEVATLARRERQQAILVEQKSKETRQRLIGVYAEEAKAAADPLERIRRKYEGSTGLIVRAKERLALEKATSEEAGRQLGILQAQYKAELEREQKRQSDARKTPPAGPGGVATQFINPVDGRVSSAFGPRKAPTAGASTFHPGIDIAAPIGTPVKAAAGGVGIYAGKLAGLGNAVIVDHGAGTITEYGHLSRILATKGQGVGQGDVIAEVGNTGISTGPHLDYRVKVGGRGGRYVDPRKGTFQTDPTTTGIRAATAEQKSEAKSADELADSYKRVIAALDPLQEATDQYRETLAEIGELVAKGAVGPDQQIQLMLSAMRKVEEARARAQKEQTDRIFGVGTIDAAMKQMDETIAERHRAAVGEYRDGMVLASEEAAEALRYGIAGAADLFGIRINGPLRKILQPGGVKGQADDIAKAVVSSFRGAKVGIDDKAVKDLSSVLQGASIGQAGASVFASITGGKRNDTTSAIGGALGNEAGKAVGKIITKEIGGTLGKTLGNAAGPIGSILGGVLGNLVGGLFSKPKYGTAVVAPVGQKSTAAGNSEAAKSGATSLAGAVQQGIQQIADALGGTVGAYKVSIGTFNNQYRVSTTGFGGQLDSKTARNQGLVGFGENGQDEAIAYAISDALLDGAIQGISAASRNILSKATQDGLQKALNKALLIEGIPRQLKQLTDPVGAAIDDLNKKFKETVDALKEGGATAEQMAQAQQLYNLQLADVKANTASATQSLKDFLKSLNVGGASPLSLRDQEATAKAALQPFLDTINGGGRVDQAKYQTAAQDLLDIERQIYGSSKAFFDTFDAIQAATAKAIATIDNAVPITPAVESPFAEATAANTKTLTEMTEQQNDLLRQQNELLQQFLASGGSYSDFIGTDRLFKTG